VVCLGPSTAHHIALDFSGEEPRWTREPPGFLLHRFTPGAGLSSHVVACGHYPSHRFG